MEEITICIPARNEESVILPTLDAIIAMCDIHTQFSWRILVVDNASEDDTAGRVLTYADPRVVVISEITLGKGAAVVTGAKQCRSTYFVYIDADLSANPHQIPVLIEKVREGNDIAIGSRLLNESIVHRSLWRTTTSKLFQMYAQIMVPVSVSDSQCPLKVMNEAGYVVLASCVDTGWFFDREFLAKAWKQKLLIEEVPIFWEEFRYPNRKSKLHVLSAGLQSLVSLWKIRNEVNKF